MITKNKNTPEPAIHLTFDVEENPYIKTNLPYTDDCFLSNQGCSILIPILEEYHVRATFFITGYFAEKNPDIVKRLHEKGHEIASHSYKHQNFKNLTSSDLESEIKRSTEILSNLIGEKINGFRAPFCCYRNKLSAMLKAHHYQYDSSLHPAIVPGKYYNFFSPVTPFQEKNGILEIPISVLPVIHFPISWWWMRNLGSWVTHTGTSINLHLKRNVILYFHPWEFVDLSKMKGDAPFITRNTGRKFCEQLKNFIKFYKNKNVDFVPIRERIPSSS